MLSSIIQRIRQGRYFVKCAYCGALVDRPSTVAVGYDRCCSEDHAQEFIATQAW